MRDESMRPAFLPGDRILIDPAPGRPLVRGDVVVVRDPESAGRLLLKRVAALEGERGPDGLIVPPGRVYLLGDLASASRDSRAFGSVPVASVEGVAWWRYAPARRRGPVAVDTLK